MARFGDLARILPKYWTALGRIVHRLQPGKLPPPYKINHDVPFPFLIVRDSLPTGTRYRYHLERPPKIKMAQATTLKEFETVFPTLAEDLLAHAKQYGAPQMALDWYKAVRRPNYSREASADQLITVVERQYHWRQMQPRHVCA